MVIVSATLLKWVKEQMYFATGIGNGARMDKLYMVQMAFRSILTML